MTQSLNKPISFSDIENSVTVFDRVSKKELVITKWDKLGRGNTSVSAVDGTSVVRSYISFSYEDNWYQITVDDITGISINKIKEKEIEDNGPLLWLKNAENNNW